MHYMYGTFYVHSAKTISGEQIEYICETDVECGKRVREMAGLITSQGFLCGFCIDLLRLSLQTTMSQAVNDQSGWRYVCTDFPCKTLLNNSLTGKYRKLICRMNTTID